MRGLSLVVTSGGNSLISVHGLFIAVVSLADGARVLRCVCSIVVAYALSCPTACGIFPDQGLNPFPLHRQVDSQPQGIPAYD